MKNQKIYYAGIILVVFGVWSFLFSIAKAMSEEESQQKMEAISGMNDEEVQAYMAEIKGNPPKANPPGGTAPSVEEKERVMLNEGLEKRINNAKMAFEKNQVRFRIAKNIVTSTVSQLKLEGTDVEELIKELKEFEARMSEIEGLYNNHLNELLLFERENGEDPGKLNDVFRQAREKKEKLLDFYKNSFRIKLEDALDRNEKEKFNAKGEII
jgi:hypothetical protein